MTILDANILIYAWNSADPSHRNARRWIETLFAEGGLIGIPWVTTWAFIRITTNGRVFPRPLTVQRASAIAEGWLRLPNVTVPEPGRRHFDLVRRLAGGAQATGTLFSDAVLAALAVENAATLASTDRDFARFQELKWVNPLER